MTAKRGSFVAARRGRLTLLLSRAAQFLDVANSSIMNVALPSIRRGRGFPVQNLQRALSGYLVTYGGGAPSALLATHTPQAAALTAGFHRALLSCAAFLLAAAVVALRANNTRGEPAAAPDDTRAARDHIPAPELTD